MSDLALHIQATPLMDTHEHLNKEQQYVEEGPDVLQMLFDNYIGNELIVAGAPYEAVERLVLKPDPDLEARWDGVKDAWQHCQYTGYGQAVRYIAQHAFGMEEITLPAIEAAAPRAAALLQPGERLRLLKEVANLDHVQVDDFEWACLPDDSGPEFFLYDLSWEQFSNGRVEAAALHDTTGVEVQDLASLRQAMAGLFERYGPCAIAVKSQHAYERTLYWQAREPADAEHALQKELRGQELTPAERLCLGDWCLAQGVELSIRHELPFKIHTGYLAGHSPTRDAPLDRVRPSHLHDLLHQYPAARFVLMHISYPYENELAAVAKFFPNVYVDMCWSWSINPYAAADFVRRMIHSVPVNKLFAFGGDTFWPYAAVAYAHQARAWLTRALQAEIADGLLDEAAAIKLATRLMRGNQEAVFDLAGKRAAIRAAL